MKKFVLTAAFILLFNSVYAKPKPPVEPFYSEVYTVNDCLNAYDGTTCIITGKIINLDTYHDNRYIIQDNTGQIAGKFSHHVIGNHGEIIGGTYKIIGELRGAAPHPEYHNGPKPHRYDPHIAVRYIEKQ